VCVYPNPRHEFQIPYIVVNYLTLDVVVRFINISGIVDHHCLIYLFIKAILILPLGVKKTKVFDLILFDFWCLAPLSAIFQLYHGDQFSGGRRVPGENHRPWASNW
jgi:hypothetical protein